MPKFTVAALYQFLSFPDYKDFQGPLKKLCEDHGIKGTLLLAQEGINGTIAGSRIGIDHVKRFLKTRFQALEYKESWADEMPFRRLKIRLTKEIVTLGVEHINPAEKTGTYIFPQDWNKLISDPDVLVLDTRNDYEVQIGTFQGAQNPKTQSFTEFPKFVQTLDKTKYQRVAMFCTGGIRCEKASAYMLLQGFKDVYHLKGGILKYLEEVAPEDSLWEGDCFVFDGRIAVCDRLSLSQYTSCHGCRRPLSEKDKASPHYERGVSCSQCYASQTPEKRKAARQRQYQEDLALQRGQKHIGAEMPYKKKAKAPDSSNVQP